MPVSLKFYCAFGHLKKNLLWVSRPTRKDPKIKAFTSSSSCSQLSLHQLAGKVGSSLFEDMLT